MLEPLGDLNFLGERKRTGSWFSVSSLSKEEALRLLGEERELAVQAGVRFTAGLSMVGWGSMRTILTVLETREVLQA